jgi:diguanylate cyclase (GGDEF)-like protein/PAS domain S-box-containing protein
MSDDTAAPLAGGDTAPPRAGSDGPERPLLERLIDGLPAMVAYWDAEQRNVLANEAFCAWFGVDAASLAGRPLRELLGPEPYEQSRSHLDGVISGEAQRFELRCRGADGRDRALQVACTPDLSATGSVRGFSVLMTEVAALADPTVELQRAIRQYRALARSVPGAFVVLFDTDLRYLIADGIALQEFGVSPERMEGHTLWEAVPGRATEIEPYYRAALEGRVTTWDRVIGRRVFALTAAPVVDKSGNVFAGMVVSLEVTAARQREAIDAALHQIATASARGGTADDVLTIVSSSLCGIFGADYAAVCRFDDPASLRVVSMAHEPTSGFEGRRLVRTRGNSAAAVAAHNDAPCLVDYREADGGDSRRLFRQGFRRGAAAPIRVRGALWGAIAVGSRDPAALGEDAIEVLTKFADLIEITISNAEAWDALNQQARLDGLTGIPNRRAFDERLAAELAAIARSGRPLSLVIFDLDNLKAVNDADGHIVGDRALVDVAHTMSEMTRANELIARFGGDEFALILPDADNTTAQRAAERMRAAVDSRAPVSGVHVTLSGGIATTTRAHLAPEALITQADRALYEAKRAGRNTIRSAPPDQLRLIGSPGQT